MSFVLRRSLLALPSLLGIALLTFLLIRAIPGDAIDFRIGTSLGLTRAQETELKAYYGLDKPMYEQFGSWFGAIGQGDLGISLRTGGSVGSLITRAAPVTLELTLLSLIFAMAIAIPLGTLAALRPGSWFDVTMRTTSVLGLAIPEFLSASLVVYFFSAVVGWYPNASPYVGFLADPIQNLSQILLPAAVLGLAVSASVLRVTRSAVLSAAQQEYVRAALSRGVPRATLIRRYILRNALIPIITIVGVMTGYLLTGAVIVEQIFSLPGLGRLLLVSILQRDYPVVEGTVLVIAATFILANLLADIAYAIADPRVRQE